MSVPSDRANLACGEDNFEVEYGLGTTEFFIRIEHTVTTEVWANSFTREYIEELTHKAGSFKELSVFFRMLAKSLEGKDKDVVSVTLYSQDDLQHLKKTKKLKESALPERSQHQKELETSKYLVLTYRTEYDRVQYPLPLLYAGEPDPKALIRKIRRLQEVHKQPALSANAPTENQRLHVTGSSQARDKDISHQTENLISRTDRHNLQIPSHRPSSPSVAQRYRRWQQAVEGTSLSSSASIPTTEARSSKNSHTSKLEAHNVSVEDLEILAQTVVELRQENKSLRKQISVFQQQLQSRDAHGSKDNSNLGRNKELDLLRQIVSNLEHDVISQKNRFQRALQKKTERIDALEAELTALQVSERNLRVKCRHLTNELAARRSSGAKVTGLVSTPQDTSRSRTTFLHEGRSSSAGRYRQHRSHSKSNGSGQRSRPNSRSPFASRTVARSKPSPHATKPLYSRSPSPTSGRFDPTAYVRAREEKLRAVRAKREGKQSSLRGRSSSPVERRRKPSLSPKPLYTQSQGLGEQQGQQPRKRLGLRGRSKSAERAALSSRNCRESKSPEIPPDQKLHKNQPQPTIEEDRSYFKTSEEIEDIDARLAALSKYLQRSSA